MDSRKLGKLIVISDLLRVLIMVDMKLTSAFPASTGGNCVVLLLCFINEMNYI